MPVISPPVWLEVAFAVVFGALWVVSGHWSLMLVLAGVALVNAAISAIKPIRENHVIRTLVTMATVSLVWLLAK